MLSALQAACFIKEIPNQFRQLVNDYTRYLIYISISEAKSELERSSKSKYLVLQYASPVGYRHRCAQRNKIIQHHEILGLPRKIYLFAIVIRLQSLRKSPNKAKNKTKKRKGARGAQKNNLVYAVRKTKQFTNNGHKNMNSHAIIFCIILCTCCSDSAHEIVEQNGYKDTRIGALLMYVYTK